MKEASLDYIRTRAYELHNRNDRWHFHILSPSCVFNRHKQYAFILEGPNESLVHYSSQAEKHLGQELSPLLHGSKIKNKEVGDINYRPSETVREMTSVAKELTEQRVEWHHHVLFPGCHFNRHAQKFVLILEDPRTGQVFESLSEQEPTDDLRQIESLFYKAK